MKGRAQQAFDTFVRALQALGYSIGAIEITAFSTNNEKAVLTFTPTMPESFELEHGQMSKKNMLTSALYNTLMVGELPKKEADDGKSSLA